MTCPDTPRGPYAAGVLLTLLGAALSAHALEAPTRIDALEIHGLWRTERTVVERELGFGAGEVVTPEQWQLASARLWNLGLFSRVEGHVEPRTAADGKPVRAAVWTLEERWTLNPLFSFASGGNVYWLQAGASDTNVGGRAIEVAAQYERFQVYDGGMVVARMARLGPQRFDVLVGLDALVRPRPGFSDRRLRARAEVGRLFDGDRLRVAMRGEVFADQFIASIQGPDDRPPDARGALLEASLRLGRVDVERMRHVGVALELRQAIGAHSDRDGARPWSSLVVEMQAFAAPGVRWNVALRTQAAVQNATPVHLRGFLGGLDRVRGYVDNRLRADAYAFANLEVRHVTFDSTWLAVLPVAFLDAALANDDRPGRGSTGLVATGAGVRLLVPRFVRTGLRIDVAVPLREATCRTVACPGLAVGVYQFF